MRIDRRVPIVALLAVTLDACNASVLPEWRPISVAESLGIRNDAPRRNVFPPTPAGVHLNLVFNYAVRHPKNEIGVVDVVWGASSPYPPQVFNQFYTPFEREGSYGSPNHSIQWWKTNHPDWIEYRCDKSSIAWEFNDRHDMPLDIANPSFRAFQRTGAVDPALAAGYRSIDFDNLSLGNYASRCGHYDTSGHWVAQYTGSFTDPAYAGDVIAWARDTYVYVHAYSSTATMAINYSYQGSSTFDQNLTLMKQTDEVLDERGFTNWGGRSRHVATPQEWHQIVRALRALQSNRTCYMENGEEPQLSRAITQTERLWVVANYLLTRDDCTYVWMSGFSKSGQQQYGRLLIFPEYELGVGVPTAPAVAEGLGWRRAYRSGLTLVNPSTKPVTFKLYRTLYDENGILYKGSLMLPASSGQVLLTLPPSPKPSPNMGRMPDDEP